MNKIYELIIFMYETSLNMRIYFRKLNLQLGIHIFKQIQIIDKNNKTIHTLEWKTLFRKF